MLCFITATHTRQVGVKTMVAELTCTVKAMSTGHACDKIERWLNKNFAIVDTDTIEATTNHPQVQGIHRYPLVSINSSYVMKGKTITRTHTL